MKTFSMLIATTLALLNISYVLTSEEPCFETCKDGQYLDEEFCHCFGFFPPCPSECPFGQFQNEENCECTAYNPKCIYKKCPADYGLDVDSCSCVAMSVTEHHHQPETQAPCVETCKEGTYLDEEFCHCFGIFPPCASECPFGQFQNEENCECTSYNPKCLEKKCPADYGLDVDLCKCVAMYAEEHHHEPQTAGPCSKVCAENEILDQDFCFCDPIKCFGMTCEDGSALARDTCECRKIL